MISNKNVNQVIFSLFVLISISACSSDTTEKELFIINEDFGHFFYSRTL